jgi:hypothetical protein
MVKTIKKRLKNMFRWCLVNSNSLEFRAKTITLMIATDRDFNNCKQEILEKISNLIYSDNKIKAELLRDTVHEYYYKIMINNNLDYEHLLIVVEKEIKETKEFAKKINLDLLETFITCIEDKDDKVYQKRVFDFLKRLKAEYS